MPNSIIYFVNSNIVTILVSLISFIRFLQFRFASDSATYHFAYPLQIIQNKEFFHEMNNFLWKTPHFADSINLFLKDLIVIHLFWSILPILNIFYLIKLTRRVFINLKINYVFYKKDLRVDLSQYVSLILILSAPFLYTIASGHTEQLNILFLLFSFLIILPNQKSNNHNNIIYKTLENINFKFILSGFFIGLTLCSKISIVYFLPQIIYFSILCLIRLYDNDIKKSLLIKKYIYFCLPSLVFTFLIYLVFNKDVLQFILSTFNIVQDSELNFAYRNLRAHIFQTKLDYQINFINSIRYLINLAIYPFDLRFPSYVTWMPNLFISWILLLLTINKQFRNNFKIKRNDIYLIAINFFIFIFCNFLYFKSGLHNPRHLLIPSIINSLVFILIYPRNYLWFSKIILDKIIYILFILFSSVFIYFEFFGVNLPNSNRFSFSNSRFLKSEITKLLANLENKSKILNLSDSILNVYSTHTIHYPSPYWQYGVNFNNKKIDLEQLRKKFDFIIYFADEEEKNKCNYGINKQYNFINSENTNKYRELRKILIRCSDTLKFTDIKLYKSNFRRKKVITRRLVLASLKE